MALLSPACFSKNFVIEKINLSRFTVCFKNILLYPGAGHPLVILALLQGLQPLHLTSEDLRCLVHNGNKACLVIHLRPGIARQVPQSHGHGQVPDGCSQSNKLSYLWLGPQACLLLEFSLRVVLALADRKRVHQVNTDSSAVLGKELYRQSSILRPGDPAT